MNRLFSILANAVFAIQILLIFLLVFEQKVMLPLWLQPLGRMHPLLLHLPVGLLLMVALWQLFRKQLQGEGFEKIMRFTLYLTAITTSLTALMGFFLSREEGYASELMDWHKWTGVALSFISYGLLLSYENKGVLEKAFQPLLVLGVLTLLFTGHFGASLTHGEDFLWAPLMEKEIVLAPETPVFEAAIAPVLERKCQSCHNPNKRKGKLDMSSVPALLAGGENGPIWEAGDAANSTMIQRVHLPEEDEEHMPPDGKPQLSPAEITLLETWINQGADVNLILGELEEGSELEILVSAQINNQKAQARYDFEGASEKTIAQLNNPFRSVHPLSLRSPALAAQLFVRSSYSPQSLQDLLAVKTQLVSLNLSNMPVSDADLNLIGEFSNLEKLVLNGTDISGENLGALAGCQKLRSLALSNTQVKADQTQQLLEKIPGLEEVFLWHTAVSQEELADLSQKFDEVVFEYGYIPEDTLKLALTPPVLVNESKVLEKGEQVELKHNFPGATVRFTLDGTDPDSLSSSPYTGPIQIDQFTEIRALAYHENWLASEVVSFAFFPEGHYPEEVQLLTQPNRRYRGELAATLHDGQKGSANQFRSPFWLGYRKQPLQALFDFGDEPPAIQHVTLSYARNIGSYIMPPAYVEVWGGDDPEALQKLIRVRPPAANLNQTTTEKGLDITLPASGFRYYQIIAEPVRKLPSWHPGAGGKAWVFVDEVFWY
jgi:uncharacterized membrane protein/mono/diheme cytochrome c family protein